MSKVDREILEVLVLQELKWHTQADETNIEVEVDNGVVKLTSPERSAMIRKKWQFRSPLNDLSASWTSPITFMSKCLLLRALQP